MIKVDLLRMASAIKTEFEAMRKDLVLVCLCLTFQVTILLPELW